MVWGSRTKLNSLGSAEVKYVGGQVYPTTIGTPHVTAPDPIRCRTLQPIVNSCCISYFMYTRRNTGELCDYCIEQIGYRNSFQLI